LLEARRAIVVSAEEVVVLGLVKLPVLRPPIGRPNGDAMEEGEQAFAMRVDVVGISSSRVLASSPGEATRNMGKVGLLEGDYRRNGPEVESVGKRPG
jgi:hypothetical protein